MIATCFRRLVLPILLLLAGPALAQESLGEHPGHPGPGGAARSAPGPFEGPGDSHHRPRESQASKPPPSAPATKEAAAGQVSTTHHTIEVRGRTLAYTATAGLMPIYNDQGKLEAELFYVAYIRQWAGAADRRPITFAFNGGPGASTIWLHLAALGPRRTLFGKEGTVLPADYRLVRNEYTWLGFTDLVFIDPPGTGYSRIAPGIDARQFYSLKSDVRVMADFIRLYLTRQDRWLSPKFLAGESYGTTRAAALASHLQRQAGMTLNGLVLISAALDFQAIVFGDGNDLPYVLFLPAYAAVAWYHHRLPPPLRDAPLEEVLAEVEGWAMTEFRQGLAQGDSLAPGRRRQMLDRYCRYTGLPERLVDEHDLRIDNMEFTRHLLRGRIVGILDGRVSGLPAGREGFVTDPSVFLALAPLMATFYDYTRTQLDFRTDRPYEFLNMQVGSQWTWGSAIGGYPSVLGDLRQALSANPRMRVLLAAGIYDLDTSYFSQKYTIDQLRLDPAIRSNIRIHTYPAGHQLYTYLPALESLTDRAADFYVGQ